MTGWYSLVEESEVLDERVPADPDPKHRRQQGERQN
jgi:hypothetical protein